MRIACLVTVCGLLPIIISIDGGQLLGFNATNLEDVVAGSKLLPSHALSSSGTEIDVRRTTRSVREPSPTPFYSQPSNRRIFNGARSSKRPSFKRSGNSLGANDIHADESIEKSEEIHIEPLHRLTEKSTIESIVDLIRGVVEPAKKQLGPLIGPVRFPGVGEKVYIRLPEPVENESKHVLVRLLSRPVIHSSSAHSLIPAGEPSAQSSNRQQSTHLPPSPTIATNRRHHGLHRHRHVQSTALPEHPDVADNELDAQEVSGNKDRMGIIFPNNQKQRRQDSTRSSWSNRQALMADEKSPRHHHRYDDIDSTSRMSRVHPMSDRLRNRRTFPRTTRGYAGHRFFNNVNPQWNVRGNFRQQWPAPIRERQLISRSYPGPGKNIPRRNSGGGRNPEDRGHFMTNLEYRPRFSTVPKYSPLDVKDDSNEWRGIVVNYRNDLWPNAVNHQRSYIPVNDFQLPDASTSSSTNPVAKFHWQWPQKNRTAGYSNSKESALNIISVPSLQYFRPLRNVTSSAMNFSKNHEQVIVKKPNDEEVVDHVRNPTIFVTSVVPTTNKLTIKSESDEPEATESSILRIVPKSLKLKSRMNVGESEEESRYESLESVLRFDDIESISNPNDSRNARPLDSSEEPSGSDELEEEYDESDDSSVRDPISNVSQESFRDSHPSSTKILKSELNADEFDPRDTEESLENSYTSGTEETRTSRKGKDESTELPKTESKSSKTSKNDVLFNIMSMTASQLWNEQPNNAKSKSVLGILNIRNGGKNVVAKIPVAPEKPKNHQLLEFENSDEDEPVEVSEETTEDNSSKNIEDYKCSDISEEDSFVKSCEYDADSVPELPEASYEEK